MKLERISDLQIRCTLTNEDLAARSIKIDELAYGSDKAKSLFSEMMDQAARELNFETDDLPLVIEAVPVNPGCLVIIVTKVEDPEELDTRFAQFSPSVVSDTEDADESESEDISSAPDKQDSLLNMFKQIANSILRSDSDVSDSPAQEKVPTPEEMIQSVKNISRLFSFTRMEPLFDLARVISNDYTGQNRLYKDQRSGSYLLLLCQSDMKLVDFNRICNIVSEYGQSESNVLATNAYLDEHCDCLIKDDALSKLAMI